MRFASEAREECTFANPALYVVGETEAASWLLVKQGLPESRTEPLGCSLRPKFTIQIATAIKGPTTDHREIRAWADSQGIVPANVEPNRVDAEPAPMALLHHKTIEETTFVKEMSWEDFFARFKYLKLTLVYDDLTVSTKFCRSTTIATHRLRTEQSHLTIRKKMSQLSSASTSASQRNTMDLKAVATHPAPRGQRCSPILFFLIAGIMLTLLVVFVVLKPNRNAATPKPPAATPAVLKTPIH